MPYFVRRDADGYRVYSINGTPLSHKPLSLAQAKKQQVAVLLEERRRVARRLTGGSRCGGDESYALSDSDIQKVVGGTAIHRYPELHDMESIEEAFDDSGRAMLLYLTESENFGHWVCMMKRGDKTIEYFDSYGGYKPDEESEWLTQDKLEALGEDTKRLTALLRGYKVISNPYKFQESGSRGRDVNTCGRHCAVRLMLGHLSLPQYKQMIESAGVSPDEFVTAFTAQLLHK